MKYKGEEIKLFDSLATHHMSIPTKAQSETNAAKENMVVMTVSSLALLLPSSSLYMNGMFSPIVKQTWLWFDNNFPHCSSACGEMHFQTALVQEYRVIGLQ